MKYVTGLLLSLFLYTQAGSQVVAPEPYTTIKCNNSPVMCIAISPKRNVLAIGLGEYAELWDLEKEKRMSVLKHETPGASTVNYVAFNDNGEFVVTIDFTGKRKVWSVKSGKEIKTLGPHNDWIPSPKTVKDEMGLKMSNSDFDRFYIQKEVRHPKNKDIVARSSEESSVIFENTADNYIDQELKFEDTKDSQHLYPVFFDDRGEIFATGNDRGEVFLYKIAPKGKY